LQTAEQRIVDLAAQLGGSQANISAHLTRLKQAGLITSRPQGRAVYYRLAQPELGGEPTSSLLRARAQLAEGSELKMERAHINVDRRKALVDQGPKRLQKRGARRSPRSHWW
jgi:DNA-binding transcriptional ArsR family regulator